MPRQQLASGDFTDVWWIGDYSDANTGANAGYLAIHLINALNTTGFQITSGKNAKGQFAFEFHGHYSMSSQDVVPFEIYCKAGSSTATPNITLNNHVITISVGDDVTLSATTIPSGQTITWSSSATGKATVSNAGVVHGAASGNCIITASITVDSVTYNDTCTVIVEA